MYIYMEDPWDMYLQLKNTQHCSAFETTGSVTTSISKAVTVAEMSVVS